MEYSGLFDTHAHYDDARFDDDRDTVLRELPLHGVSLVMNPACSLESIEKSIALSDKYDFIYSAAGVHPEAVFEDAHGDWLKKVEEACKHKKVKAIGEIGLDYHYDIPKDIQISAFISQVKLSIDLDIPVIIHDREAHGDVMDILNKYRPRGIMHCYSGSAEMVKELIKLGFYIGFTGSVTFKNANKLLLAAKEVPNDRIILETDSPYMAPVPYRGQRCDSSLLSATAERLAELRGVDVKELIDQTRENGKKVYNID